VSLEVQEVVREETLEGSQERRKGEERDEV
jgi:hypothetical protein